MRKFRLGPGMLITAAFIGPGTVVTCAMAGIQFGYSILWALIFGIASTIILQEMSGRLGLATKKGLAENLRYIITDRYARLAVFSLIVLAIWFGNSAYQSGNLMGATLGLQGISSTLQWDIDIKVLLLANSGLVFTLLFWGGYKFLEKALVFVVALMGLVFVITLVQVPIDFQLLWASFLPPSSPDNSTYMIMALLGTTIVPYNLFLHSSSVAKNWIESSRASFLLDLIISICIGGVISMSILITFGTVMLGNESISGLADLAPALASSTGSQSKLLLSIGIFGAGITSSLTAPLAASYALTGILGQQPLFNNTLFRITWISVLLAGVGIGLSGYKPLIIIQTAQFANGLLLPIIGGILLWMMNSQLLDQSNRNGSISNLLGATVLIIISILGIRTIYLLF
ncbi:MAG: Nramp family divalent metal transporter [Cyclobacteriaceae bacterium]